jgi:uncharacterized protein (DUF58 family)
MHLAHRTYVLLALTAVLAIAGMWAGEPGLTGLWRWPLALTCAGIALESAWVRRLKVRADLAGAAHAYLGRPQAVEFVFRQSGTRSLQVQYVPVVPAGFTGPGGTRRVTVPAAGAARDALTLLAVRLGPQPWPPVPTRRLGRLGLIWWSAVQPLERTILIGPDIPGRARIPRGGSASGSRPRRATGAGSELHQLRDYVPGDPLSRIDWKASARVGRLVSRELDEDQHLDVVLALDAGRSSRVRAGSLDRLGLYANLAARLAASATRHDDRIGLLVFSDRPAALVPPTRGEKGFIQLRRALETLEPQLAESDPLAAAARLRALLRHRSLIVLLTDLEDPALAPALARAVRLLSPPHVVLAAGIHSPELEVIAAQEARSWRDPWDTLAAREHLVQAERRRALLRRLGAPVVSARAEQLEQAVLEEYERLRQARRV